MSVEKRKCDGELRTRWRARSGVAHLERLVEILRFGREDIQVGLGEKS